jgi:hypothetical protein
MHAPMFVAADGKRSVTGDEGHGHDGIGGPDGNFCPGALDTSGSVGCQSAGEGPNWKSASNGEPVPTSSFCSPAGGHRPRPSASRARAEATGAGACPRPWTLVARLRSPTRIRLRVLEDVLDEYVSVEAARRGTGWCSRGRSGSAGNERDDDTAVASEDERLRRSDAGVPWPADRRRPLRSMGLISGDSVNSPDYTDYPLLSRSRAATRRARHGQRRYGPDVARQYRASVLTNRRIRVKVPLKTGRRVPAKPQANPQQQTSEPHRRVATPRGTCSPHSRRESAELSFRGTLRTVPASTGAGPTAQRHAQTRTRGSLHRPRLRITAVGTPALKGLDLVDPTLHPQLHTKTPGDDNQ